MGDKIHTLGPDLIVNATSDHMIAGLEHRQRPIFGLQYHPEVESQRKGEANLKKLRS